VTADLLVPRQLNRATLARNLLLERSALGAVDAISHLVALQAQEPLEPFVGLWSRLASFTPTDLDEALLGKRVVRTLLMRRTIHLVTADDALALRPHHQAMLVQRSTTLRAAVDVDLDEVADLARAVVDGEPATLRAVGQAVAERWPALASPQLGDAVVTLVPFVQLPPRGTWAGPQLPSRNATMEQWLGRDPAPVGEPADLEAMVLRYLRTFGPASSSDLRSWCGLAGLPPVVATLAPQLRTYRDERGRTLLDVEDGVLPDPDVPAPPRFLPAFDNVVLGYADRARIIDDEHKGLSIQGARYVLVDGRVAATWTTAKGTGALEITPLVKIGRSDRVVVLEEAAALAGFLGADDVRWRSAR
jgi:hypothetical protein